MGNARRQQLQGDSDKLQRAARSLFSLRAESLDTLTGQDQRFPEQGFWNVVE